MADVTLDLRGGFHCPLPVLRAKKALQRAAAAKRARSLRRRSAEPGRLRRLLPGERRCAGRKRRERRRLPFPHPPRRLSAIPSPRLRLWDSHIVIRNRLGPRARSVLGVKATPASRVAPPGSSPGVASLDPSARLGLLVSMALVSEPARRRLVQQSPWIARRIGAAQSPRSGRSAAEQPRSGLTAMGRCGRRRRCVNVVAASGEKGRCSRAATSAFIRSASGGIVRAFPVRKLRPRRIRSMSDWSQTFTYYEGRWSEGNPPILGPRQHAFWLASSVFDGARAFEGVGARPRAAIAHRVDPFRQDDVAEADDVGRGDPGTRLGTGSGSFAPGTLPLYPADVLGRAQRAGARCHPSAKTRRPGSC